MFKDHAPPHIHAVKDDRSAMIHIRTMEVVNTSLTNKQEKRVLNWARGREEALLKAWDDLQAGSERCRVAAVTVTTSEHPAPIRDEQRTPATQPTGGKTDERTRTRPRLGCGPGACSTATATCGPATTSRPAGTAKSGPTVTAGGGTGCTAFTPSRFPTGRARHGSSTATGRTVPAQPRSRPRLLRWPPANRPKHSQTRRDVHDTLSGSYDPAPDNPANTTWLQLGADLSAYALLSGAAAVVTVSVLLVPSATRAGTGVPIRVWPGHGGAGHVALPGSGDRLLLM